MGAHVGGVWRAVESWMPIGSWRYRLAFNREPGGAPRNPEPLGPMKAVTAVLALLSAGTSAALARPGVTVDRLVRWCQGSPMQRTACDFYFVGALEMMQAAKDAEGAFSRICFPRSGLSANDARENLSGLDSQSPAAPAGRCSGRSTISSSGCDRVPRTLNAAARS